MKKKKPQDPVLSYDSITFAIERPTMAAKKRKSTK